jgi:hypothetical protein
MLLRIRDIVRRSVRPFGLAVFSSLRPGLGTHKRWFSSHGAECTTLSPQHVGRTTSKCCGVRVPSPTSAIPACPAQPQSRPLGGGCTSSNTLPNARAPMPAVYNARFFAIAGGLISYGAGQDGSPPRLQLPAAVARCSRFGFCLCLVAASGPASMAPSFLPRRLCRPTCRAHRAQVDGITTGGGPSLGRRNAGIVLPWTSVPWTYSHSVNTSKLRVLRLRRSTRSKASRRLIIGRSGPTATVPQGAVHPQRHQPRQVCP